MSNKLKIIPLGGFGEVGRNLIVLEYGDHIICIDCGLMFPEGDMPGVDIILPNFQYLQENVDKIDGYFITHGHEDHIGALPYVLPHAPAPVYATRLARGLIEVKLRERKLLDDTELHTISPRDPVEVGPFRVQPFRVSHSIPDTVGFAVDTPLGMIVHTAEYKFDLTPVDGQTTDIHRLAEFGRKGVLALLSDSTNAERAGHTPSEAIVKEALERVFERAEGRVIISTFASNISRVQEVINVSMEFDRKVAVVGRSMVNNTRMARELGYLRAPDDVMVSLGQIDQLPDDEVTIICTGTQGEPTSALVRMAHDNHRQVQLKKGDTVLLSATPIPGNEELVHRTLNELFKHGANVLYQALTPVHVSGHANREEQKLMLKLISPRYFVPGFGEYRMLVLHGKMAEELGMAPEDIFVMESGQILEFDGRGAAIADEQVPAEYIYVDGSRVGEVGASVLHDRRRLSEQGYLIVVVNVDEETGEVLLDPDIITQGFIYEPESGDLLDELSDHAADFVEKRAMEMLKEDGGAIDPDDLAARLTQSMKSLIYERTNRRPDVRPSISVV